MHTTVHPLRNAAGDEEKMTDFPEPEQTPPFQYKKLSYLLRFVSLHFNMYILCCVMFITQFWV